jgi:hypothetical protein
MIVLMNLLLWLVIIGVTVLVVLLVAVGTKGKKR